MQIGGCKSRKHVIWHGVNNIKMEVGVQPHIGTALSHWQGAFWVYWAENLVGRKPDWALWRRETKSSVRAQIKYSHLPVFWCHIMIACDASNAWNQLGRELTYRRQAANCSLMVCVSMSEEPKSQ